MRIPVTPSGVEPLPRLAVLLVLACLLVGRPLAARAATYYVAPGGNDGAAGTTAATPWHTFAAALPRLTAGDTLLLLDGTYTAGTTGLLTANCAAGMPQG